MGIGDIALRLAGITRRVSNPEKNEEALKDLVGLARGAKSIKVVSGAFPSDLYCSQRLLDVLGTDDGERSRLLIVGPAAKNECVKLWVERGFDVFRLDDRPARRFWIVDGEDARLEDPHAADDGTRVQYKVTDYKDIAELKAEFEELKERAMPWGAGQWRE